MWVKFRDTLYDIKMRKMDSDRSLKMFALSFALVFIVLIFLRVYVFSSVVVSGTSMENTLKSGDLLIVDKLREPKRGDIVVFYVATIDDNGNITYELNEKGEKIFYIKRIIADSGDTIYWIDGNVSIEYETDEGRYHVDLSETYTKDKSSTYSMDPLGDNAKGISVPENKVFVMGDNRKVSKDSREIGFVDKRLILGVVPEFVVKNKGTKLRYLFRLF